MPNPDDLRDGPDSDGPEASEFPYDLKENIGYLLRTANQVAVARFNTYMARIPAAGSVTTTQFATLTTIARFPGISFSELSAFTSIDMPTLNSLISRLKARDLVTVEVNQDDKRSRCIRLTRRGEELAAVLTDHGHQVAASISARLTPNETGRLIGLLKKLIG